MQKPLLLFIAALLFLLSSCTTTIYLVRHAERQDQSSNSPLSAVGHARAATLRDTLQNKGIDSVFSTPYLRTQQTAAPTANAIEKPVTPYSPDTTSAFVNAIQNIRGKDLLVVGHSNTVPDMVKQLTGQVVSIDETDYDNLFIVTIKRSCTGRTVRLVLTTYGPPSP